MYLASKNVLSLSLETQNLNVSHEFFNGIKEVIKKIIEFIKKCIKRIIEFFTKSKKVIEVSQTKLKQENSQNDLLVDYFKPVTLHELVESNHPAMKHLNKVIMLVQLFGNDFSIKKCLEFVEYFLKENVVINIYNSMCLNPDMMRLMPSLNNVVYNANRKIISSPYFKYLKDGLGKHKDKVILVTIKDNKLQIHSVNDSSREDFRFYTNEYTDDTDLKNITFAPTKEDLDMIATPKYSNMHYRHCDEITKLLNKVNNLLEKYMKDDSTEKDLINMIQRLLSDIIPISNKFIESNVNIVLNLNNFLLELYYKN